MLLRILILGLIILPVLSMPVRAEIQSLDYIHAVSAISEANRYNPQRSQHHTSAEALMAERVMDSKNKVIGEVRDIILNQSGAIAMLNVDLNRMRVGAGPLYLNYRQMGLRPVSNGYKMNYSDAQIEEMVPALLAGIEAAAGADNRFSVRKLIGRPVQNADGIVLGRVEDVLFDARGDYAQLLYVSVNHQGVRNKTMAIPFDAAEYNGTHQGVRIAVNDDLAAAMIDFGKKR